MRGENSVDILGSRYQEIYARFSTRQLLQFPLPPDREWGGYSSVMLPRLCRVYCSISSISRGIATGRNIFGIAMYDSRFVASHNKNDLNSFEMI